MKIRAFLPYMVVVAGIIILLSTFRSTKGPEKVPVKQVSGEDLFVEYVLKPIDVHKSYYPLILEKMHTENFDFNSFKESLQSKFPDEIKKVLLLQEMKALSIITSKDLNHIVIKKYRISSRSLNDRVLEIISRT